MDQRSKVEWAVPWRCPVTFSSFQLPFSHPSFFPSTHLSIQTFILSLKHLHFLGYGVVIEIKEMRRNKLHFQRIFWLMHEKDPWNNPFKYSMPSWKEVQGKLDLGQRHALGGVRKWSLRISVPWRDRVGLTWTTIIMTHKVAITL
jgi:hypothetical protein